MVAIMVEAKPYVFSIIVLIELWVKDHIDVYWEMSIIR